MVDNDFLLRTAGDPGHGWSSRVTANTGDLLRAGEMMTKRPLVAHADVGYAPKPAEVGILAIGDTHNPTSYTVTGKHYSYEYKGLRIDPYRIFRIYKITDPCLQHAIKKLLRAGRGSKPLLQDINEVISTLERMKDMMKEDGDA